MKYERTTLVLDTPDKTYVSVQALCVGEWYVHEHRLISKQGLYISHKSGIAVYWHKKATPLQIVTMLRRLQNVPPAPISDAALRTYRHTKGQPSPELRPWLLAVAACVDIHGRIKVFEAA